MNLVALLLLTAVQASHHERRLYEDMIRDYNILERPIANHSMPVVIKLRVSLQQLIDVDEKNQVVNVNAWLDYAWNDYKLKWDPFEYGNISDLRFPVGQIWKPDVLLYNSVDSNFDSTYPSNMIVSNNGDISWIPPGIFKISCKIDIRWFPFDEQHCSFKFGSWTYNGRWLDLQPAEGGFDVSEYLQNGEWALQSTTVERHEKFYDCCPNDPYLDVTFSLHLRRRTLYYGFNLVMPAILTTAMTLLGFTLPPDAGEKITLQITVLLSICFFLGMLSEMSPPTSEAVPLLGIFFSSCMLVVTASTVFTVYVLNLHYRTPETHEMSRTSRVILLYWLPYILRIERPGTHLTWNTLPSLWSWRKLKGHSEQLIRNIKTLEEADRDSSSGDGFRTSINGFGNDISHPKIIFNQAPNSPLFVKFDPEKETVLDLLRRIHDELSVVTKRMMEDEWTEAQSNDWKFAAMVVDKLCLYVFTIFIIGTTVGILMTAPYLVA